MSTGQPVEITDIIGIVDVVDMFSLEKRKTGIKKSMST